MDTAEKEALEAHNAQEEAPTPKGPPSLDEIIAKHRKAPGLHRVTVDGTELVHTMPTSAYELMRLEEFAANMVMIGSGRAVPNDWKVWQPWGDQEVRQAAYASHLLVEPKWSMAEALRLQHECGAWFLRVINRLLDEVGLTVQSTEEAAIVKEGEGRDKASGTGTTP